MRHRRAANNLNRTSAHRRAMVRNLVINLVEHGRIRTTVQKAKAARPLAEKIITLGKKGTLHNRRRAISILGSTLIAKRTVRKVFSELAGRFAERPGGYTRILRLPATIRQAKADLPRGRVPGRSKLYGTRLGDNADMVLWELCEAEMTPRERRKPRKAVETAAAETQKSEAPEVTAEAPAADEPALKEKAEDAVAESKEISPGDEAEKEEKTSGGEKASDENNDAEKKSE